MLKIFNTLTRQKEEFKPIHAGEVGMYVVLPFTISVTSAMAVPFVSLTLWRAICVFSAIS
jgi:hypothetical protein